MTDHSELIARLRDWRGDPDEVMDEAATALETQAAEIARLTTQAEIQYQHDSQEIAALRAQLAAAQGQDPEIDLTPRTPKQPAEALAWVERQRMQPEPFAPDCRTCQLKESCEYDAKVWNRCYCTNGDKYEEAPAVVLWRTE